MIKVLWSIFKELWFLFVIIGLMIFATVTVDCQEPVGDGSYIVVIENTEYRALPPDMMRKILKDREELKSIKDNYQKLESKISLQESLIQDERKLCKVKEDKLKSEVNYWESEYKEEFDLRTTYQRTLEKCHKFLFWRIC